MVAGAVAFVGPVGCGCGGGLRLAETVIGGRVLPDWDGGANGAGDVAAGASPAGEGCGAGLVAAGGSAAGECGGGSDGDVCAQAPTQTDEIKKDVDASNRGRNDIKPPRPQGETNADNASMRNGSTCSAIFSAT